MHEAQAHQADIMAAVTKLFAEANGQMTPERLAAVIAAALAKAREGQDNG
jgi:Na+-transporting methylmalonyl-CoA/oxaloacetate decarboxylase gamma subunit